MNILMYRDIRTPEITLSQVSIDGDFECFMCEDPIRDGPKIPGHTAIPAGRYRIIITHSRRFGRELPLLLSVPKFSGIRIHPGNTTEDTEGCLLPGTERTPRGVVNSRVAFNLLVYEIDLAIKAGEEAWIEITETQPEGIQ